MATSLMELSEQWSARWQSRRALLGSGVALVIVAARDLAATEAVAKGDGRKRKKKKCRNGKRRCQKRCVDLQSSADHCGQCGQKCGPDDICVDGLCARECTNPSATLPLTPCTHVANSICVQVGNRNACVVSEGGSCTLNVVDSCVDDPCASDGRVCGRLDCGLGSFMCMLPAPTPAS